MDYPKHQTLSSFKKEVDQRYGEKDIDKLVTKLVEYYKRLKNTTMEGLRATRVYEYQRLMQTVAEDDKNGPEYWEKLMNDARNFEGPDFDLKKEVDPLNDEQLLQKAQEDAKKKVRARATKKEAATRRAATRANRRKNSATSPQNAANVSRMSRKLAWKMSISR